MINLINSIVNKDYVKADSILSEAVELIMAKKLNEAKKKTAAKMCENGLDKSAAELTRRDVVEEEELDEAQGTYRAGYKYDPVVKTSNSKDTSWSQTATKGIDNKPDYAGKQKELRSLDNTQSSDGRTSSSMHDVVKSKTVRPDKNDGRGGDYDVSTSTNVTQRSVQEETEEELDEARVKIVKARIRGGKIQRRKKISNVPGMTLRSGKLKRMTPAERRNRKMGQRRGKVKRRAKMNRAIMKRQRSLRKRKALGL